MVRTLTERLIVLSAVKLFADACIPNTSLGKFAKAVLETVMLALMIEPVAKALM